MNKYWKYLKYVLRHKWYVLQECCKEGNFIRGIMHDLSKFRPSEFIPYADYFYGDYPSLEEVRRKELDWGEPYPVVKEDVEEEFNLAWLKHIHRNPHHWQYWILREDSGKTIALPMPYQYQVEMLADWRGAGRAINGFDETKEWYLKNKDKMILHEATREWIENELGIEED